MVAVIGDAAVEPGDSRDQFAEAVGGLIVDQGWHLQTGGLGGVMEAASRGGRASTAWTPGSIVGILPGWEPSAANPYVDVALSTGMGMVETFWWLRRMLWWPLGVARALVGDGSMDATSIAGRFRGWLWVDWPINA